MTLLKRYELLGTWVDEMLKPKPVLRINTLKIGDKELIKKLNAKLTKVPFLKHGYYFESAYTVGAMSEHFLGYIYIQEAASQIPAEVLDPKPGELVLDMCASPGSKTTQMAQLMENKGTIVALEVNNARLPALKNNLERLGVKNTLVYKKDSCYAEDLKLLFDKVLLDAPCSGNYTTEDKWLDKRTVEDFKKMAKEQKRLLETAIAVLKKGGTLVYSTCSLEPEENEENIDWILEKYAGKIKLEKIEVAVGESGLVDIFGKKLNPEISKCRRIWPDESGTQGFFIAKFTKI